MTHPSNLNGFLSLSIILFALTVLPSCDVSETDATGTIQVWLTDAPADYEAVNVDILSVRLHKDAGAVTDSTESDPEAEENGWITIPYDGEPVNLLELSNGNEMLIGEVELESGTYTQARFILGSENEVVIDGESHPLQTPSGQQSGLKLNIDAFIQGGSIYSLLIDFDLLQSIVETGNGNYILKPVLRTIDLAGAGSITGTVEPGDFLTGVTAISNRDTLSAVTDETGNFTILGAAPDTYDIRFEPSSDLYADTTVINVMVEEGESSNLGVVRLDILE